MLLVNMQLTTPCCGLREYHKPPHPLTAENLRTSELSPSEDSLVVEKTYVSLGHVQMCDPGSPSPLQRVLGELGLASVPEPGMRFPSKRWSRQKRRTLRDFGGDHLCTVFGKKLVPGKNAGHYAILVGTISQIIRLGEMVPTLFGVKHNTPCASTCST